MIKRVLSRILATSLHQTQQLWWWAHKPLFASCGEGTIVGRGEFSFKHIYLGKGVGIDYGCKFLAVLSHIYIGDKCMIGAGCDIVAGNHNTDCRGRFMMDITDADKRSFDDKDVVVEEDVWLGRRVIVLSGSRIGRGAVVSAGSVIRGRVPPYAVVVGNPARVVSFRAEVQEILAHEAKLYTPEKRLSAEVLQASQRRYPSDYLFC